MKSLLPHRMLSVCIPLLPFKYLFFIHLRSNQHMQSMKDTFDWGPRPLAFLCSWTISHTRSDTNAVKRKVKIKATARKTLCHWYGEASTLRKCQHKCIWWKSALVSCLFFMVGDSLPFFIDNVFDNYTWATKNFKNNESKMRIAV